MQGDFERCVKKGGKISTKTFSKNRYQRVCIIDGKTYSGEIKTKGK